VICTACGTENPASKKFCRGCGASLAATCPACGAGILPDDRYCGECGTHLEGGNAAGGLAGEAVPVRVEPATERRLVTVLFADVVGFTMLSEARDSEHVRALLSRYFDVCRRLIELYGGVVEKFIGDAVMAVWGAHSATEDDAERAVRAALDLVAAVTALGDEIGIPHLRVRAGVLTGEATVTVGAVGEGMVAGDVVNTAARVQSLAEPGRVLVGDSTRRATEPTVVYEDAGEHELKGKIGLHRLWRAVRIVSGARGSLKSEGLEAPFVGRERELRQIKDLFHACAEERRAHLVSVTGIAGIGKSRLVWEFYKYFDGLAQVIYWHRGRCPSYGEGVTYWALADMVRMRCRIGEDEPDDVVMEKLAGVLDAHISDPEERAFVEPRVAHLLGVEGGRFEREDLFSAWRLFFERLADVYPTVLAFEDMQWADASLLDFVEHLLEWSRNSPLYVITAARPELVEKRPTWGAGKRNFTSLYLEPLGDAAMRDLLNGLVAGLPDGLAAQILARSEGVPLYAVETVRMLLDRGHVVQEGSVYRATGPVETLEVPETLHALIAARLDGLTPAERLVVQNGAVLGKTFTKHALAALADADPAAYDPILTGLVRKEVLSIQTDPRSPEHGQYGFLQDLMRRVAYETLSRRERRLRHLAAAAHLEAIAADDDELVEVLAAHYLDAYEAVPDAEDADGVRERARALFVRAAERAESLGAPGEAQRYFTQAGALAEDDLSRAGLLDRAGQMAMRAGDFDNGAKACFEEAIAVYAAAGDSHAAARVTSRLAFVDERSGRHELALKRMEDSLAVIGDDEPDADVALLTVRLGNACVFVGDIERARELTDRALDMGEALGLADILVRGWSARSMIVAPSRRHEAQMLLRAAAELALEHGLFERASTALGNLSDFSFGDDRYEDALGYLGQVLELARRTGDRPNEWFANSESTYALYQLGRWDEAMAAFAELPEEQLPSGHVLISPLTGIMPIHLYRGELDQARALCDVYERLQGSIDVQERTCYAAGRSTLELAEGRPEEALRTALEAVATQGLVGAWPQSVKLALVTALEAAFALGRRDQVEELLARPESQPVGLRSPLVAAHVHRFRGRLAETVEAAELEFAEAERILRDRGIPFWLAVALLEHAEARQAHGGGDATALVQEARETFAALRTTPWVARADALAAPVAATSAAAPAGTPPPTA
jgi:class 3 adenylate cyclase/tetratricopeptide (TPR) repeat protein